MKKLIVPALAAIALAACSQNAQNETAEAGLFTFELEDDAVFHYCRLPHFERSRTLYSD